MELPTMENNSHPPAPATPAKVTAPVNEPPKTTQASSNHEVVPMAARTATMSRSAAQPQRGSAVGSVPLQQHRQPLSRSMLHVLEPAGSVSGPMFGTAQCSATMPRPPTAVGSLACRPLQQTNPFVFGHNSSSSNQAMQGLSSTQAMAATALPGPTAQHGAALRPAAFLPAPRRVRRTKLMIRRPPSPPPPKLPVYRPPAPPRPELGSSSAAGNALLQPPPDTGFCVLNMQADPPSPDEEVTMAEEASDSEGGGGSGDYVKMLDLNFPPVSDEEN